MRIHYGLAGAALFAGLIGGTAVAADNSPSAYVAMGAGVNWILDQGFTDGSAIDSDIGWLANGALGYRATDVVRTEIEVGYGRATGDLAGGALGALSGRTEATSLLVNLLLDLPVSDMPIQPYIGGGVGMYYVKYDFGPTFGTSDSDWAFGYQGIAGASIPVNDELELYVDGRYRATTDLSVAAAGAADTKEYRNVSVMAGLRYTFWREVAAAPAPQPAPVVEAPQQFVIYFEFDKSNITDAASQVLDEIRNVATGGGESVNVAGHTDTSGSVDYNVGLSQRRAENTAAGLQQRGVQVNSVTWLGESSPAVQTGDGIKEPLNRRSEITIVK